MTPNISTLVRAFLLALAPGIGGVASADINVKVFEFAQLNGWQEEDHQSALWVFLKTCSDMKPKDWRSLCALAVNQKNPKLFFELFFRPVFISNNDPGLFTGYFEPELNGSRTPTSRFRYPVYKLPPNVPKDRPWFTRREIETKGILANRELEIAWVDDPVELFFLQIQGSGRVRLPDGDVIRLGYGGYNGQRYKSIGAELVRRGIYKSHEVSAQVIQNWVKRNPISGRELLRHSPGFVFFREIFNLPAFDGPVGAMNRSLTTLRSLAVDPKFVPLGAPVWLEKQGKQPLRRLMIAQDTGSAIKGPQRGDVFVGTGGAAGRVAGRFKDAGRMFVLMPIQRAYTAVLEPNR